MRCSGPSIFARQHDDIQNLSKFDSNVAQLLPRFNPHLSSNSLLFPVAPTTRLPSDKPSSQNSLAKLSRACRHDGSTVSVPCEDGTSLSWGFPLSERPKAEVHSMQNYDKDQTERHYRKEEVESSCTFAGVHTTRFFVERHDGWHLTFLWNHGCRHK